MHPHPDSNQECPPLWALVVADSLALRRFVRRLLADVVQELVECAEGRAALVVYGQAQPDWVLLDLEMASVDGLTSTRQLRACS